jgi:hypothetical protein
LRRDETVADVLPDEIRRAFARVSEPTATIRDEPKIATAR